MKKIFYGLFITFIFLIGNQYVKATFIDCSKQPYACAKCVYTDTTETKAGSVVIYINSDGTKLLTPTRTFTGKINDANYKNFGKIRTDNFVDTTQGENDYITCPNLLNYNIQESGSSAAANSGIHYIFSFEDYQMKYKLMLDKEASYNNKLPIFNNEIVNGQIGKMECVSNNDEKAKIVLNKDTKQIEYYYDGQKVETIIDNNILISKINSTIDYENIYKNGKYSCPVFLFHKKEKLKISTMTKYDLYEYQFVKESFFDKSGESAEELLKKFKYYSGEKFTYLLSSLKYPLSYYSPSSLNYIMEYKDLSNNKIIKIDLKDENKYPTKPYICNNNIEDCQKNSKYYTETAFRNIRKYCNDIYTSYVNDSKNTLLLERKNECRAFDNYYKTLLDKNLIEDYQIGCEVVGEDFANFLIKILNIVKIAGPIIAIVLSSIDFIKVFVQDEADKEMKTALKRFTTRIIAAVMLFLVPFVLAFLMDLFLKNQPGYDKENPFCMEIDWEK